MISAIIILAVLKWISTALNLRQKTYCLTFHLFEVIMNGQMTRNTTPELQSTSC